MLSVAVKKARASFTLDAQFDLPTPGVVTLFGRSGCGKSTLVQVIAGLLQADAGRVVLDDHLLLDTTRRINRFRRVRAALTTTRLRARRVPRRGARRGARPASGVAGNTIGCGWVGSSRFVIEAAP